jgi:predicted RNA methylase
MRVETIGDCTLYLGDCRELLPTFEGIDAVCTDPPYGVRDDAWDDMSEREFARFSMAWLAEAARIAPEAVIFGYLDSAVHRLCQMIYPRVRPMIWAKPPGSQLSGASERKRWFAFEAVFHCHQGETWSVVEARDVDVARLVKAARDRKGLTRGAVEVLLRGKKTGLCYRWEEGSSLPGPEDAAGLRRVLGLGDEFDAALRAALDAKAETVSAAREQASKNAAARSDVLSYRTVTAGRHPCEKPIGLMDDLIETTGDRWRSVLDPFLGSGSTGVACTRLGRRFVGIEQDPTYFDIACKRIEEAYAQPRLFDEPAPKPVQPKLFGDAA